MVEAVAATLCRIDIYFHILLDLILPDILIQAERSESDFKIVCGFLLGLFRGNETFKVELAFFNHFILLF